MKHVDEKRVLAGVLKSFNREPGKALFSRWVKAVLWLAVCVMFFGLFKMGFRYGSVFTVLVSFTIGIFAGIYSVYEIAARQWPFLHPHINRESVEARLAELDENGKKR